MAKTNEIETQAQTQTAPSYDDGSIVTMRIGGYLGALPYRQYPEMDAADQRALNVGRRYLAERAAQSGLAKAMKEPGCNPQAFLHSFLANWTAPVGDSSEFTTVGSMRADIGRAYIAEKFNLPDTAEGRATIEKNLPAVLVHPRHGEEIARRLAAKFAEYVAPKKRDEKAGAGSAPIYAGAALDLDAA